MEFFLPQFQVISDLHLETPVMDPQYADFKLNIKADNVLLLGDIGLIAHKGLFDWLRKTLDDHRLCRIFYVIGNHEPYRTTYEDAVSSLRQFEAEAKMNFSGRFKFLCRDRYDINNNTILGCTLWSDIDPLHASEIVARSTNLNKERGIRNWTLERHQE